ncbi:helix-turn-helix domain-containing protein [Streptomyces violaceusniger]|uniref:TetR/AcrR family transcriptional regulator n=1 Tax=Streptomyces violaceusniger TaxID=68280 RepID=UPI0031D61A1D
MAPHITPLRGARARAAILEAAGRQFMAEGLRRTSIEAIAAAAGVSRPTVYAHFASKDEVFRTIVSELHDEHLAAMEAAVDSAQPIADRLYAALVARFVPFVTLTASAEHGAEFLDENNRVCGDINQEAHKRSLRLLERLLADADADGELVLTTAALSPALAATLFYDAARGAKDDPTVTPTAYRQQLRRLVTVLARGLGATDEPRASQERR